MKIAISVESACDLSKEMLNKYDIKVIPFHVTLGDDTFKDGEKTVEEIFRAVDGGMPLPKTNAINEFEYTEWFEGLRKDYDAVVHIALSSELSSSFNNSFRASKNVKNTYSVDSKSLSTGIALLAIYARELADAGESAENIAKKISERVEKVQASFVIERLDYLFKGGRCNSLQYFGANLLKLRPRIVLKDGKMGSDKKYRGNMEKVVAKYCEETLQEFDTPDLDKVFITYSTATPEMIDVAKKACFDRGFKNVFEAKAGCTVSSHCGANTLGILYFNDGTEE